MKLATLSTALRAGSLLILSLLCASPVAAAQDKNAVVPLAPQPSAPSAAVAPATEQAKVPDTSNIMFIQNMRKIGATIYYLGEELGLHGWFVVKDGQVQILYTTPDQRAVMIGALLSAEGANISQQQVMVLANNNPEIQKILKNSAAVTGQAPKPQVQQQPQQQPQVVPRAEPPVQTQAQPAASDEVVPPSQKFFEALAKSANVTFGKDSAPQLIMIMDVNCPHCHKTWTQMQPMVDAGTLRVTMVPIAALGPQSAVEAANWLLMKDPYDAWKKHVAGDEKIFKVETPPAEKVSSIRANTELVQKWGVDQTPYILYHGKNGRVRLIIGEPKSIDDIMSDIK